MNSVPSAMTIALSIWARAITLNALLIGVYMFFHYGFEGALILVLAFIIGFVVTLPVLVVIPLFIKLAAKIPYGLKGRLAGLSFFLIALAVLFYTIVAFLMGGNLIYSKDFQLIILAAIVAVVLATRSVKNSFSKLTYNDHEQQLI